MRRLLLLLCVFIASCAGIRLQRKPQIDISELKRCIDTPCAVQWGDQIVIPFNVADGNLLCFQRSEGARPTCMTVGDVRSWVLAQRKAAP